MLLSRRRLFVVCQPAKQLFVLRFPRDSERSFSHRRTANSCFKIAKQGDGKEVNDNRKSMEDERHGTFCVDYCGFLLRIEGEMELIFRRFVYKQGEPLFFSKSLRQWRDKKED